MDRSVALRSLFRLGSNGNLDLDTGLDVDDDLLDNLSRGIEIDQTLVYSHLVHVPRLATLTTGCLSGGDLESLGRQTDGTLDAEVLGLCALEQFGADLLKGLDFARSQGDADLVDFLFMKSVTDRAPRPHCQDIPGPRRNPSRASGKTSLRVSYCRIDFAKLVVWTRKA